MKLRNLLPVLIGLYCLSGCETKSTLGPQIEVAPIATSEVDGIEYRFYVAASPAELANAYEPGVDAMNTRDPEAAVAAVIIVPVEKVTVKSPRFRTTFQHRDGSERTHTWAAEEKKENRKAYVAISAVPSGFVNASTTITEKSSRLP